MADPLNNLKEQTEDIMKIHIEELTDFIMKKCLWQFHSRAWDRERQNEEILTRTMLLLCDEPVDKESPEARCYWVDALYLADSFRERFSWLASMDKQEIRQLMRGLKDRIDFLTITGSLNEELTVPLY